MSRLKTFIVEDSAVIRQNLIAALEELAPVTVVGHAEGASGALAWVAGHSDQCDLMIVDIFLREGSGTDVLKMLRDEPGAPRRVVLTNYATPQMRAQCLKLGAERVFDKSADIEQLIEYCDGLARDEIVGRHS